MKRLPVLLLAGAAAVAQAGEVEPETCAFVEIATSRDTYFVHEPIRVTNRH